MLTVALAMWLAQAPTSTSTPDLGPPVEPGPGAVAEPAPPEPGPGAAADSATSEPGTEVGEQTPPVRRPKPPRGPPWRRYFFETAGALGASAVGLGLTMVFSEVSRQQLAAPRIDATFAVATLSSLLIAGAGLTIHHQMGGKGEVMIAFLAALAVMAGAGALANALDGSYPNTPLLASAIGAVPASLFAVVAMELSSPAHQPVVYVVPARSGVGLALGGTF